MIIITMKIQSILNVLINAMSNIIISLLGELDDLIFNEKLVTFLQEKKKKRNKKEKLAHRVSIY